MVNPYPDDFDHDEYQAYLDWLEDRNLQEMEAEAWAQMEKENKTELWLKPQNEPFKTGYSQTSTGSSKESKPPPMQGFRTSGPVHRTKPSGSKQKPAP